MDLNSHFFEWGQIVPFKESVVEARGQIRVCPEFEDTFKCDLGGRGRTSRSDVDRTQKLLAQ